MKIQISVHVRTAIPRYEIVESPQALPFMKSMGTEGTHIDFYEILACAKVDTVWKGLKF